MNSPISAVKSFSALLFTSPKGLKYALLGWAFCLPISISLAEPLAFFVVVLWGIGLRREEARRLASSNPLLIPVVVFIVLAVAVSVSVGIRPELSARKFHRLALLGLVFALEGGLYRSRAICTAAKMRELIQAYLAGCALLGLYDIIRVPLHAWRGLDLFDAGNMRDPQFYLVALCLLAAMEGWRLPRKHRFLWCGAVLFCLLGVILHFKRGVWFSLGAALVLLTLLTRRWYMLLALALLAIGTLFVPQVRARLELLREEGSPQTGGRYVLWTETAPSLYAAYPHGIGWCAAKQEDFARHSVHPVQEKLNHLHNNVLQVRLELGWPGVAAWILLIGTGACLLVRACVVFRRQAPSWAWMPVGLCCAYAGLLLNGLVEWNFGDTEILMLFCLILGQSALSWRLSKQGFAEEVDGGYAV